MPVLMLQNPTPDTVSYMILGYVIMGAVALVYVGSLLLRQRNLKRDLDVLERLQDDED